MTRDAIVAAALEVPGWRGAEDLVRMWDLAHQLPADACVVQIGVFLGRSTLVLGDARRSVPGAGPVHAVDPLDGRSEPFSAPHYAQLLAEQADRDQGRLLASTLQAHDLEGSVLVHATTAEQAARDWAGPVALLDLDGDQSPEGAASAFDAWLPHLSPGALILLGNSADREYAPTHDGHARLLERRTHDRTLTLLHRGDTSVLRWVG